MKARNIEQWWRNDEHKPESIENLLHDSEFITRWDTDYNNVIKLFNKQLQLFILADIHNNREYYFQIL